MSAEDDLKQLEARIAALEARAGGAVEMTTDGMVAFPQFDVGMPPIVPICGGIKLFEWDAKKKQIRAGGVLVGRRFVQVAASAENKADKLYSLKVTLGASPSAEIVDDATLGQGPDEDVSYIPIYRIVGGKVKEDYRGCATVPAYE